MITRVAHNGVKQVLTPEYIGGLEQTRGTETSKYPEERKSRETPLVVASERGPADLRDVSRSTWKGAP